MFDDVQAIQQLLRAADCRSGNEYSALLLESLLQKIGQRLEIILLRKIAMVSVGAFHDYSLSRGCLLRVLHHRHMLIAQIAAEQ